MQLIRHGAHLLGQRTDTGDLGSRTPEPRRGCHRQQGMSSPPPIEDVRACLPPMCRTTSTHPSRRSAPISSICISFTTTTPLRESNRSWNSSTATLTKARSARSGRRTGLTSESPAANTFAASKGLKPFTASSAQFSLAEWTRSPWPGAVTLGGDGQRVAREWYATHELPVFAWSSLARGFFSDHYDPKHPKAPTASAGGVQPTSAPKRTSKDWSAQGCSRVSITSPSRRLRSRTCCATRSMRLPWSGVRRLRSSRRTWPRCL